MPSAKTIHLNPKDKVVRKPSNFISKFLHQIGTAYPPLGKVVDFGGKTRCGRKLAKVEWRTDISDVTCNACLRLNESDRE